MPPDYWVEAEEVLEADHLSRVTDRRSCGARPCFGGGAGGARQCTTDPHCRQRSVEGSWGTLVTMSMINVGQTWSQDVIGAASVRVATSHLLTCVRTFSYL